MRKVIISLAPIKGAPEPVDPRAVARDIIESIDEGASMCHLHSKNRQGILSPDHSTMSEIFTHVLAERDVVIQASTGGISEMDIIERCNPLSDKRVETASLNGGTTNLGEAVYVNSFSDIRYCAAQCYEKDILPEIEVFDIGMIHNIQLVRQEQRFRDPVLFNLVFGHKGGMQPTIEALTAFRSFVPSGCLWGVTHFGRDNWTFLAAAIAIGAVVVRCGFEDSAWLAKGKMAQKNVEVVRKLRQLIEAMGLEAATADEARQILNLTKKELS